MDLKLQGKAALITGGSKGIGLATACTLAAEGAEVALLARGGEALEAAATEIFEKTGRKALIIQGDVSVQDDAERAVHAVVEAFGSMDILINNAGASAGKPFEEISAEAWEADLDLKLMGAVHMTKAAVPHMRANGGGAIVNVTAIRGKTPSASSMPSSVSRAAGLALTKAMSKDLAKDGIRVNAVCIGLIRSDQIERMWKSKAPGTSWEQFAADPAHGIPLGRIGDAQEAANAVVFLVSGAASYLTGTSLNIDGGAAAVL